MKVRRIDHIGVIVEDFDAATAFFVSLGLDVEGELEFDGGFVDRLTGLDGVKTRFAFMRVPGAETGIELITFLTPVDERGVQPSSANTLGIRHIAFLVEEIEAIVAKLKANGAELVGELQQYEDSYKLCYVRGPEGIIVELAEQLSSS